MSVSNCRLCSFLFSVGITYPNHLNKINNAVQSLIILCLLFFFFLFILWACLILVMAGDMSYCLSIFRRFIRLGEFSRNEVQLSIFAQSICANCLCTKMFIADIWKLDFKFQIENTTLVDLARKCECIYSHGENPTFILEFGTWS